MDIERLKELKDYLRVANELSILNDDNLMQRIVESNDVTNTIDIAIELLNAEIARQSVKSEEVAEAMKQVKGELDWYALMSPNTAWSVDDIRRRKNARTIIASLQAYQLWVPVSERLPEIPEGRYGVTCNVMVDNCSSTKVMSLLYEKDTVRGKTVCRWKWYGKISPWNVTHWKPLTEPPEARDDDAG